MEEGQTHIERLRAEVGTTKNRAIITIISIVAFILFMFALSAGRGERAAIRELKTRNAEFIEEMKKSEEIRDSLQYVIDVKLKNIITLDKKLENEKEKYRVILESPYINDPDSLRIAILRAARQRTETKKDGVLHSGRGK